MDYPKTNLPVHEMVPDRNNPAHDPQFWCLPPIRGDFDEVVAVGGGYEFHLVTHGRQVGVWRDWSVAKDMVLGFPRNGHKGHHSYEGCIAEWQQHCPRGVHPHPVDPSWKGKERLAGSSTSQSKPSVSSATPLSTSGSADTRRRRSRGSVPPARLPSTTAVVASGSAIRVAAAPGKYYALWGAGVVYSTVYAAGLAFDDAVDDGEEPELLSTNMFEAALAYAEGNIF